ncbi:MAG: DUF305 domain-containing protein [Enhygromyxa sp.]
MSMSYWRFAAMIATSTLAMFILMYLNTYALDHLYWSETRAWMALLMGAMMAVIMLAYMRAMYRSKTINAAIFVGSALVFAASLWLVRSQATISGVDYMRAMIPHHSIAVLTSDRAQIVDPRVRKLADEIIATQRREIAEMKYLIHSIEREGAQRTPTAPELPPAVVPASEALRQADLARVDLAELDDAELNEVLGAGPRCGFAYSRHAGPVVAATLPPGGSGPARGVLEVHGRLVELQAAFAPSASMEGAALSLHAEGIEVTVSLIEGAGSSAAIPLDAVEAQALLRIDAGIEVGYGGFYRCDDTTQ